MAKELSERVREVLKGLGESADDVASILRANEVKGLKRNPNACPLHNYLAGELLRGPIWVGDETVCVGDDVVVPLTFACEVFVDRFDQGLYEDLVEETTT